MVIGYARVSTSGQETAAQEAALRAAGVDKLYTETASGGRWDRPELQRLLEHLRPGDTLVVWKLDRLSRSLRDLLHLIEQLEERGAYFRSLTEAVDTTSPAGRMMASMLGAVAQFERDMLRERTRAGLEHARSQGRVGGRPKKLTQEQERQIYANTEAGVWTGAEAARLFGVHPSTITRLRARYRQQERARGATSPPPPGGS